MSEPWLSTHIERWPTEKLVPYARNARTHSEEQARGANYVQWEINHL